MESRESLVLHSVYRDILNGMSPFSFDGENLYIKHLSAFDQAELDERYFYYYDIALFNKMIKEKEKLEYLKKTNQWSEKDDAEIETKTVFIDGLNQAKKNCLPSQIKSLNDEINTNSMGLHQKTDKREYLIGMTAEKWAAKKLNLFYMFVTLYEDRQLTIKRFIDEKFNDAEHEDINALSEAYMVHTKHLSHENFKKLAIAPFFQSIFGLCSDDCYKFYARPISLLTYYQINLFRWGRDFKHIFSQKSPPKEIESDPEAIIDWYNGSHNLNKEKDKVSNSKISGIAEDGGEKPNLKNILGDRKSMAGPELLNKLFSTPM